MVRVMAREQQLCRDIIIVFVILVVIVEVSVVNVCAYFVIACLLRFRLLFFWDLGISMRVTV